jgi:hypothetical protein
MTANRKPLLTGLGVLCTILLTPLIATSSASAAFTHAFVGQFPTGAGTAEDLAVDNSNNVYVVDQSGRDVLKFDSSGNPANFSALGTNDLTHNFVFESSSGSAVAVDNSGGPADGDIYVTNNATRAIEVFSAAGTYLGNLPSSFSEPLGVDVSSTGTVIVGDWSEGVVRKFTPSANPLEDTLVGTLYGVGRVGRVATDSTGAAYVSHWPNGPLVKYEASQFTAGSAEPSQFAPNPFAPSSLAFETDPANDSIYVDSGSQIEQYSGGNSGAPAHLLGPPFGQGHLSGNSRGITIDDNNKTIYVSDGSNNVLKFGLEPVIVPDVITGNVKDPGATFGTLTGHVDPLNEGEATECHFEYGTDTSYSLGSLPCEPATSFSNPTDVTAAITGLTTESSYHYRLVVSNINGTNVGRDRIYTPHVIVGLTTEPATNVTAVSATFNGSLVGNGEETHYYFQWGVDQSYGYNTAIPPGVLIGNPAGPEPTALSFVLENLTPATTYHYQVIASTPKATDFGGDESFTTPPARPLVTESVSNLHSDSVLLGAKINPGGGETTYHFEWGSADCSVSSCTSVPVPDSGAGSGRTFQDVTPIQLTGLSPGTTYHSRVVASNAAGRTESADRTFTAFPFTPVLNDPCSNAHVRQQTGAALLPDCRAYELVSAADTGGYDVESSLVAGQTPFGGYPQASNASSGSRVLYAIHFGGIPGIGDPTNSGPDPYVAVRGNEDWSTEYVGIPASDPFAAAPFASTLAEADPTLDTFAFGGASICSPCFADGSSGIPVHLPDGRLVQGMTGSIPQPSATPAGYIGTRFSADGIHFVFGSTSQFESDGNNNGDVSIYDRNLKTGVTHVVSKTPGGATMTGAGIGELGISSDGSRIVVGQKVSTDSEGRTFWHLFMNVDDSAQTIDLTPGTTTGAIYDGMSADGSKVFFTTKDQLSNDSDNSADIYQAEVSGPSATISRISTGIEPNTGDVDACDPTANSSGEHWNTVGSAKNCDAIAVAAGGGVASENGSIYFLSPELLDGPSNGTKNSPNLYVVRPGSAPHYVATLEPNNPAVIDAVAHADSIKPEDFQVTPNGEFAIFTSTLPLTEYDNVGYSEVFRYDAVNHKLECASCNPTNATATGDATLASNGLSLADDGRVFFSSSDALVPRDLDNREDAYEWEESGFAPGFGSPTCTNPAGCIGLISTGISLFDSKLLSVGADGTDAYFFTHDTLVPQDENGTLAKIYDARSGGGFPYTPPPAACQASDECHGASSEPPPPPAINTVYGTAGRGNTTLGVKGSKRRKHHHRRRHHRTHRHG